MGAPIAQQEISARNLPGGTDVAGSDFDGAHSQSFFVDHHVYLTPNPAFRAARCLAAHVLLV